MELTFECDLKWDDFEGGDPLRRYCGRCEKMINNVSAMTRTQAREFFRKQEGKGMVCISFESDGARAVFADDPENRLRRQRAGARQLALAAAVIAPLLVLGCDPGPAATAEGPQIEAGSAGAATPGTRADSSALARYRQAQEAKSSEPCKTESSIVDDATAALEKMYRDLFADEEERKFHEANHSVTSGGMMF